MKELSIEEKSKRYDEVVARLRHAFNSNRCTLGFMNEILHYPKENEDEKIRKALIEYFRWSVLKLLNDFSNRDVLAWLEKQENPDTLIQEAYELGYTEGKRIERNRWCEKKHKFNVGDIISNGKIIYRVDNIVKNAIGQDSYFLVNVDMEKNGIRYLIVTDSKGKTSHMGEITWLCEQVDKSFEKQGEQKLPIEKLPEETKTIEESLGFTTQKECDEYNQIVSNLIMSDDKVEQKPAWSKEDEIMIANIRDDLFCYQTKVRDEDHQLAEDIEKEINWLKSIKHHNH